VLLANEDLRILAIKYKAVTSSAALLETDLAPVKSKSDAKLSHSTITIQIGKGKNDSTITVAK
jgi:hypothetical protein